MPEKPLSPREGLPWVLPGALIGAGLGITTTKWLGPLGIALTGFLIGVGCAVGYKIADVRKRNREGK